MNRDELLAACFGASDLSREQKMFETTAGSDVVSHVGLSYRRVLIRPPTSAGGGISVASETVTVAAISNVCTDPDYRLQGFARANLEAAHADASTHETVAFAALFAGDDLFEALYRKLGYLHPDDAPTGFYVLGLREDEEWPAGRVDTLGRW